MRKSRERTERLLGLVADPETADALFAYVAEGGTLREWCLEHDVRYGDLRLWLVADASRAKLLAEAESAREASLRDRALAVFRDVADADLRGAFGPDGALLPASQLPAGLAGSLTGAETYVDEEGKTRAKVRFSPRERGAELLARTTGLFRDSLRVDLPVAVSVVRFADQPTPEAGK